MSDKDEKTKTEAYMGEYMAMVRKLQVLSRMACRQLLGIRPDGDPRLEYLAGLETFKNMANAQLEVVMELVIRKLGISKEDFLKLQREKLASQIKAMEEDLCVTGWDKQGNPLFDLPRYVERTKSWPK